MASKSIDFAKVNALIDKRVNAERGVTSEAIANYAESGNWKTSDDLQAFISRQITSMERRMDSYIDEVYAPPKALVKNHCKNRKSANHKYAAAMLKKKLDEYVSDDEDQEPGPSTGAGGGKKKKQKKLGVKTNRRIPAVKKTRKAKPKPKPNPDQ